MENKNMPTWKLKIGAFETCVWENWQESGGRKFKTLSVSMQKSLKLNNEWRTQKVNLMANEVQKVLLLLQKTQEFILTGEKAEEPGQQKITQESPAAEPIEEEVVEETVEDKNSKYKQMVKKGHLTKEGYRLVTGETYAEQTYPGVAEG